MRRGYGDHAAAMRHHFLHAFASLTAVSLLALACGGKVVFDGAPSGGSTSGSGGNGGAFSATSSSGSSTVVAVTNAVASSSTGQESVAVTAVATTDATTGPSVGVGPACDCNQFCNILEGCGFNSDCMGLCMNAPPPTIQCVCSAPDCNSLVMCAMGSATSGSGMGTGGGGPGQPLPQQCRQCVHKENQSDCAMQFQICQQDPACQNIRACHTQCGYGPPCEMQCDISAPPSAQDEFYALMQCDACDHCQNECGSSAIEDYCNSGGSAVSTSATAP